ncbi:hypothetical protein JMY81_20515 [Brenneria goodwinii]|uniref:hypothetical protein n=1 Tax=Brenneria goodwinii TaxID=1109412 RepID=UPI000EF248EA|nr:hypothetical protein [Brenneria goodwinii]MCG8157382.1 hypothetical protein [Brenneria goodwinii]MCG8163177.1 hypothetical protein [Brenneria goodwinii]MCG8165196.1 hypothetical protein [Brenneria goodwinii]MCG8170836.1 hypothetical protein [Brenneria goodwinii]MCG8175963.1 hypothetical protein [Brenneria goodwinii]
MKKQLILAGLVCVVALAGCARTAPVLNVTTPIAAHHTDDQVKKAILQAGLEREWVMTPVSPGLINGHLDQRGHVADIRINYSPTSYSINYVSSRNLIAGDGKIHRNYNRWINNLDREIQLKLAGQQIK